VAGLIFEVNNGQESGQEKALLPMLYITLVHFSQKTSTAVDNNRQCIVVPWKRHVSNSISKHLSLMNFPGTR
jgi:hypothetical protein